MPNNRNNPHNQNTDGQTGPSQLDAPWRLKYIESLGTVHDQQQAAKAKQDAKPNTGCFIRDYWLSPDDDNANHIIERTNLGMIFLNRYPYANGHLLVALGQSRSRLLDYTQDERAALWQLVDRATDLMERTLEPHGINTGINQGRAAGAGVPGHLHVHLVPRWEGDVNFVTTVGDIRVIPGSLEAMAGRYRNAASDT
ncbi:MAG: HIT family hydrolase [Phycisphaera sp.]|nr:MAG: HIT family hydrolase [Phycisphaera sp.]